MLNWISRLWKRLSAEREPIGCPCDKCQKGFVQDGRRFCSEEAYRDFREWSNPF